MRLLIVEDEYLIAAFTEATLAAAGFSVVGRAATVAKALQFLQTQACDAAVLDVNLGKVQSTPVAEALKTRGIPFLVVSSYGAHQLAGPLAAAPFLAKPFKGPDLVAAVRALPQKT